MRTRAQASRDAALRRLSRVNHTLAIAAVVGTGVITDVVANTATSHARTTSTSGERQATDEVQRHTATQESSTEDVSPARHKAVTHHRAAPPAVSTAASSSASSASPPAASSSVSAPSPAPVVVAVSGGS